MTLYITIPITTKSFAWYLIFAFCIITEIQLQQKWKNLWDSYTREVNRKRKLKSGSAASGRKHYLFFAQFEFLANSYNKQGYQ
jgi:hypothetical protein